MSAYGFIPPPQQELRHCTHSRIHIRNANDAHRIFEAVRLGLLPLVTRRLTPTERDLLRSGQVFVWEEGSSSGGGAEDGTPSAGLERWTDGRRWSQSRMREPFLFYEEKIQTTQEEKHQKAIRRARKASTASDSNHTSYDPPIRRQDRPSKPDGLTKQTYSSFVYVDGTANGGVPPRKWHCVAYFNANDYDLLPGPEAYPELRNISIPPGVYTSTKGMGRATAAITGGALRPVVSGLGNGSMGSVGNYGSTMGVLDIGGISGVHAEGDVDWNRTGSDAGMDIDTRGSGGRVTEVGTATAKVYIGRPHEPEPQGQFDLERRPSSAGTLAVQYQSSHGGHSLPLTYSGYHSSTSTSTSTSPGSPGSPKELSYTHGRYSQGPTSYMSSIQGGDCFHGSRAHSSSHPGSGTFSRSASYPSQPTSSTYPTHPTHTPSTVLPLPIPRSSWSGASGGRTVRSSEDAKAINAFRLAL